MNQDFGIRQKTQRFKPQGKGLVYDLFAWEAVPVILGAND